MLPDTELSWPALYVWGWRWRTGMSQSGGSPRRSSFIVRIDQDDAGGMSGMIERVRTGVKEAFRGVDEIGALILRMVEAETGEAREASRPPGQSQSRPVDGARP